MKLALIQPILTKNIDQNFNKAIKSIQEAAKNKAKIVCLPELFCYPYFCQNQDLKNFQLAQNIPGPISQELQKLAKKLKIVIIAPYFERRAVGLYHNSALVLDADGSILGLYRKMHIPDDPGFNEKYYFAPGDLGYPIFQTKYAKIGLLICWDQWFSEPARILALKGAQIIFYPTAIGWGKKENIKQKPIQLKAWQTVQKGHAIANNLFVAAVNRTGIETLSSSQVIEFWGHSFICDPQGHTIAQAQKPATTIYADIDLSSMASTRTNWPFFRDRRIDSYQEILKRAIP
jgi:N-carbamoylputrescine amidase